MLILASLCLEGLLRVGERGDWEDHSAGLSGITAPGFGTEGCGMRVLF